MRTKSIPFYFRTQTQYDNIVKAITNYYSTSSQPHEVIILFVQSRLYNATIVVSKKHPETMVNKTHGVNKNMMQRIPKNEPTKKKWIGSIKISPQEYPSDKVRIRNLLLKEGAELIMPSKPKKVFKDTHEVFVNITSSGNFRHLASMLDKKIGVGKWKIRGPRNWRTKLMLVDPNHWVHSPNIRKEHPSHIQMRIIAEANATTEDELKKIAFLFKLKKTT